MRVVSSALLSLMPSFALACPNGGETLVSCTLEQGTKQLQTCLIDDQVTYSFGHSGQPPELQLSGHVREVDHYPWPGVSRTIWEAVIFENAGISYRVFVAQERDPRTPEVSGGIFVDRGEDPLAELTCDAGSVEFSGFPLALYDAKVAAGQNFNRATYSWE